MGKQKRPRPIVTNYRAPAIKSRRLARKLTTEFHRIQEELTELEEIPKDKLTKQKRATLNELRQKLENMGGREMYQEASAISTEHFKSSRFVFQQLTKQSLRPRKKQPKLKTLELGAVNCQLLSCPWLEVRAIDLRSRHPRIEEKDFFAMEMDSQPTETEELLFRTTTCDDCKTNFCHGLKENGKGQLHRTSLRIGGMYDVIVNSMVINSVVKPDARGEMLKNSYKLLRPGGRLFLMLPRRCIEQSMSYSVTQFVRCLTTVGFRIIFWRNTPKIAMLCLQRTTSCHCTCHNQDPWLCSHKFTSEEVHDAVVKQIVESNDNIANLTKGNEWPWNRAELAQDATKQRKHLNSGNTFTIVLNKDET